MKRSILAAVLRRFRYGNNGVHQEWNARVGVHKLDVYTLAYVGKTDLGCGKRSRVTCVASSFVSSRIRETFFFLLLLVSSCIIVTHLKAHNARQQQNAIF